MKRPLAISAALSMLVFGLLPLETQPAVASTQTVTDGNCSIEVNDSSGVVVNEVAGDCVVEFKDTEVDYEWTVPSNLTEAWVLVVGGGGEGGTDDGGGGGAGEFVEKTSYDLTQAGVSTNGKISISVGAGGAASVASDTSAASNGEDSIFGLFTAKGGGGGGHGDNDIASLRDGRDGGSGGGAAGENYTGKSAGASIASDGVGNAGGTADNQVRGGGGGGAGEEGNTDGQGHGGDGLESSITGTPTFYAGGGGGGGLENETSVPGGQGGGGRGGGQDTGSSDNKSDGSVVCPTAGEPNTGGGGGGNGSINQRESFEEVDPPCNIPGDPDSDMVLQGMPGGSGVVIVRFAPPPPVQVVVDNSCSVLGSVSTNDVTTQTASDGDCIVSFLDPTVEYEWVVPDNLSKAHVLVVGGGGGGGNVGGGGAGGFLEKTSWSLPVTSKLSIRVGRGGQGSGVGQNLRTEDEARGQSSFIGVDLGNYSNDLDATSTNGDFIQAIGGGGGASITESSNTSQHFVLPGLSGASSGGSLKFLSDNGTRDASISSNQPVYADDSNNETHGNVGGGASGSTNDYDTRTGGGGGGAGGAGGATGTATGSYGGNGGVGKQALIDGNTYAGGGGGGAYESKSSDLTTDPGEGSDGGGDGAAYDNDGSTTQSSATSGQANTGGGGGGGAYDKEAGADGGSGIVIVRYTIPPTPVVIDNQCSNSGLPQGVTTSDDPDNCIVEFTSPGIQYDVTLPAAVTFDYLLVGGGGAGGSSGSTSQFAGGGGGGGQVVEGTTTNAESGLTITVGSGGKAVSGSNGENGKKTELTTETGQSLVANQGKGGTVISGVGGGGASGSGKSGGSAYGGGSDDDDIAGGGGGDAGEGQQSSYCTNDCRGGGGAGSSPTLINIINPSITPTSFGGGGGGGVGSANTTVSGGETSATDGGGKGTKSLGESGLANTGGGGGGSGENNLGGNGGSGFAAIAFTIPFAELQFSEPTATATGFTFRVSNYDDLITASGGGITWSFTGGTAEINVTDGDPNKGLVTVTGLTLDQSDTITVTADPNTGGNASKAITGNSLKSQSALTFNPADMKFLDTQSLSATGGDGVGEISFSVESGTCTIEGNVISAETDANDCTVKATKAADAVFAAKDSETKTITVSKATRRIEFTSSVPLNPEPTGSSGTTTYTPEVSITNKNGEVISDATATITIDSGLTDIVGAQAVCSITGGIVSFDEAGTCVIDAKSDNTLTPDNYLASTTISQVIEIGEGNQNITFDAIPEKTFTSAPFKLNPTSSADLPVTLTESSDACSLTGSAGDYTVTIDAVGDCEITASQQGNSSFAQASPVTRTFAVKPVVPGPPILESVGFDDGAINISFKAPSFTGGAEIDNYSLVATDDAGNSFANNDCGTTSPCTISGLTNGIEYTPTLTAINAAGESTAATAPAITPAGAANSVTELVLTNGDGELTANWTKPADFSGGAFTSYELLLTAGSTEVDGTSITNVDTTTATFTGLTNGVEYQLELIVFSEANDQSLASRTATTTGIPATAPSVVRNITAEIESFDKAFISWVEPASNGGLAITGYELSIGTDSTTTDTFRELTGLPGGDTEITIKAINDVGESTTSFTLELPDAPAPPSPGGSGGSGGGPSFIPQAPETPGNNPGNEEGEEGNEDDSPGNANPPGPTDTGFTPTPPTPTDPGESRSPVAEIIGSDEQPEVNIDPERNQINIQAPGWQVAIEAKAESAVEITETLEIITPMRSRVEIQASGLQPETRMQAWIFSDPTYIGEIATDSDGNLLGELSLPDSILPGPHTLQLATINAAGETVVINKPIIVKGKITVGTFKGFIAIYSKDLEGQRLSAKVAGKWLVQDPIDTFKDFGYGRVVRFTGAGYDILVDVYLNREFFTRVETTTR